MICDLHIYTSLVSIVGCRYTGKVQHYIALAFSARITVGLASITESEPLSQHRRMFLKRGIECKLRQHATSTQVNPHIIHQSKQKTDEPSSYQPKT